MKNHHISVVQPVLKLLSNLWYFQDLLDFKLFENYLGGYFLNFSSWLVENWWKISSNPSEQIIALFICLSGRDLKLQMS